MKTEALNLVRAIKAIPTEVIPKWKVLEAINETLSAPAVEKRAPVQGYPGGIPWAIHLEAYEVYCKRWSPQPALIDLEGRNCRGGFSTGELDDFIPGWRDRVSEFGELKAEVKQLRAQLAAAPQAVGMLTQGPPALYLSSQQVQGAIDGSLEPTGSRYLPFSRDREGLFDTPVYLAAPQADHFDWSDYRAMTDLPEVDEAIRALLDDQTEDNATCLVRAIVEAAGERLVQLSAKAEPQPEREPLTAEQLHTVECMDSWAKMRGLPTYSSLAGIGTKGGAKP